MNPKTFITLGKLLKSTFGFVAKHPKATVATGVAADLSTGGHVTSQVASTAFGAAADAAENVITETVPGWLQKSVDWFKGLSGEKQLAVGGGMTLLGGGVVANMFSSDDGEEKADSDGDGLLSKIAMAAAGVVGAVLLFPKDEAEADNEETAKAKITNNPAMAPG